MNALGRFLKTTVLGGAVFLVPLTIVVYLGIKAFAAAQGILEPLTRRFPDLHVLGVALGTLATGAVLLALCFAAGLVARSVAARSLKRWVEDRLLSRIPGYTLLRSIAHGALGHAAHDDLRTALVDTGGARQIGFVAETLPDGRLVVFVPEAPEALSGDVLVLDAALVRLLDVPVPEALQVLRQYGAGTAALLAARGPAPGYTSG